MKKFCFYISSILFLLILAIKVDTPSFAQQNTGETLEAVVMEVVEQNTVSNQFSPELQTYQKLKLNVTAGSLKGKNIVVENGNINIANNQIYDKGDRVIVNYSKAATGQPNFYITGYIRRMPLTVLFLIFVLFVVLIGKIRGISSLLAMIASFAVIFVFILPRINNGQNPVVTAITGSALIIPLTFYLSHGLSRKTTIAILGTFIALIITSILATFFVDAAKLTGFASEEAAFLQFSSGQLINMKGLLLAGIIIGSLGVLDDITISQSSIVYELKNTNPNLSQKQLYQKAMNIGQDHISSMVNTLILVYTGAALPLLLLFINNPHPFTEIINYEIIADEVVRTLVGSIGLILAVPITTALASVYSVADETQKEAANN
jgi:uncharacterized membrane protein